jgi:hypothetical protein
VRKRIMAALLNFYFAPDARGSVVRRLKWRPAIQFTEIAARVSGAVAEIVVFLWATLVVAFFGLVAAGFLFE